MFEQATLIDGPSGKRVWTTFLGLTSQVALVSFAVLAPMVWPQALPATRFWESLAPPMPPGPKPLGDEKKQQPARVRVLRETPWAMTRYQPASVPTRVYTLIEEPPTGPTVIGGMGGERSGSDSGVVGAMLQEMTRNMVRVAPPVIEKPAARAVAEPAPAIPRYTQGGNVHLGEPLLRAEPQYPPLAKAARMAGDVELECVVGIDGRIHEVKVKSGNPLLVRAAVDAAWKWVYGPSKLNGVPIEIVTILKFSFKLN